MDKSTNLEPSNKNYQLHESFYDPNPVIEQPQNQSNMELIQVQILKYLD